MTENEKSVAEIKPDNVESFEDTQAVTTPQADVQSIKIPIKFNKEIRQLDISEATTLAQKGMKFDLISGDLDRLRLLAQKSGESVTDFITLLEKQRNEVRMKEILEECGGNEQIARRLLDAEEVKEQKSDLDEVSAYFPHIKQLSDLPQAVVEKASLTGENLLNCLLRYRLDAENKERALKSEQRAAAASSVGSLKNSGGGIDAVNAEFLRGLWGR